MPATLQPESSDRVGCTSPSAQTGSPSYVLEVYEPIGTPSPAFLAAIVGQGYLTEAVREEQAKRAAQEAVAAQERRKQSEEDQRQLRLIQQARAEKMKGDLGVPHPPQGRGRDQLRPRGRAQRLAGQDLPARREPRERALGAEARLFPPGYGCLFLNGQYRPPYEL